VSNPPGHTNRRGFRIDLDPGKVGGIGERLELASPSLAREVGIADCLVIKQKPEPRLRMVVYQPRVDWAAE
jgi:hypothetical protein